MSAIIMTRAQICVCASSSGVLFGGNSLIWIEKWGCSMSMLLPIKVLEM